MTRIPDRTIPYNFFVIPVAEAYYRAGAPEKGNEVLSTLLLAYPGKAYLCFWVSVPPEHGCHGNGAEAGKPGGSAGDPSHCA
jgi:hypothetical protein